MKTIEQIKTEINKLQVEVNNAIELTKINQEKIISFIQSLPKSSTFISVISQTEPKMRKTGNPYYSKVIKISKKVYCLNFDYGKSVERIREKSTGEQNEYISKSAWFELSDYGRTIVRKKSDKSVLYLYGMVTSKPQSKYFLMMENGKFKPINKSLIDPFLSKKKKAAKGEEKPIVNAVALKNIRRLKYGNKILSIL